MPEVSEPEVKISANSSDRPVLRDLVNHVITSVANHWYDLGLQLLDPKYENELNIIEADKDDTKTCCRKMFRKWLDTDKLASWDKVIEALTLIELDNVASNIRQLLRQGCPPQPDTDKLDTDDQDGVGHDQMSLTIHRTLNKPSWVVKSLMMATVLLFCVLVLLNVYMHHSLQEHMLALQHEVKNYKVSETVDQITLSDDQKETSLFVQDNMKKKQNKIKYCKSTDYVNLLKSVKTSSIRDCDKVAEDIAHHMMKKIYGSLNCDQQHHLTETPFVVQKEKQMKAEQFNSIDYVSLSSGLLTRVKDDVQTALSVMMKLFEEQLSLYYFCQWPTLMFVSSYSSYDDVAPVYIKMSNVKDYTKCTAGPWYSKPFFTFDKGYMMRLVVRATCGDGDDDSYLSVHLYLMKGPHDDQLERSAQWPLTGKFKVELLQQRNVFFFHHFVYITFSNTACSECSNRVLEGDMATSGWGKPQFVSYETVLNEYNGFLEDDTLYFRVSYHSDKFFDLILICIVKSLLGIIIAIVCVFGITAVIDEDYEISDNALSLLIVIILIVIGTILYGSLLRGIMWSVITIVIGYSFYLLGCRLFNNNNNYEVV